MAVVKVAAESVLRLRFNTGVDAEGNPTYRNKNLRHIKADALDSDLYEVAQALAGLVSEPLAAVNRVDTGELVSQ